MFNLHCVSLGHVSLGRQPRGHEITECYEDGQQRAMFPLLMDCAVSVKANHFFFTIAIAHRYWLREMLEVGGFVPQYFSSHTERHIF